MYTTTDNDPETIRAAALWWWGGARKTYEPHTHIIRRGGPARHYKLVTSSLNCIILIPRFSAEMDVAGDCEWPWSQCHGGMQP